jgi:hypothetical protein
MDDMYYVWLLQVNDMREDIGWVRRIRFNARTLEEAVRVAKDIYLLWPHGSVQCNEYGDEAQFFWHEKQLEASLSIVEDEEE